MPPKIVIVSGRNLPLDALAAECGIDEDSPRLGQALVALNGSRGQPGIRHLFWKEAHRWADENERLETLSELVSDPEWFAVHLAQAIPRKAALYRERMHGAILTATALRGWWLDLEKQAAATGAGLTPEEIANIS
jgi:hypothetical protein